MRALVVSTTHPNDPAIFGRWVRPLVEVGWDVLYAAPFADHGVAPQARLTGLDLPVEEGEWITRRVATGMLRHRGPEADAVIVSSGWLAELAPEGVTVLVARGDDDGLAPFEIEPGLTRWAAGRAGSSARPSANAAADAAPDRSAIPRQSRGTTPAAGPRADASAR